MEGFKSSNQEFVTGNQLELSKIREKWVNNLTERGLSPETCSLKIKKFKPGIVIAPQVAEDMEVEIEGIVNGHKVLLYATISNDDRKIISAFEKGYVDLSDVSISEGQLWIDGNKIEESESDEATEFPALDLIEKLIEITEPIFKHRENDSNEEIESFNSEQSTVDKIEKLLFPKS